MRQYSFFAQFLFSFSMFVSRRILQILIFQNPIAPYHTAWKQFIHTAVHFESKSLLLRVYTVGGTNGNKNTCEQFHAISQKGADPHQRERGRPDAQPVKILPIPGNPKPYHAPCAYRVPHPLPHRGPQQLDRATEPACIAGTRLRLNF